MSKFSLKRCPFCGDMPIINGYEKGTEFECWSIKCGNPYCMASITQDTFEETVRAWNKRESEVTEE